MKILELEIFSSRLEQQYNFYAQVLGLNVIQRNRDSIIFQIGHSMFRISYSENATPYHFAINIPANQVVEALDWLEQRVDILKYENIFL